MRHRQRRAMMREQNRRQMRATLQNRHQALAAMAIQNGVAQQDLAMMALQLHAGRSFASRAAINDSPAQVVATANPGYPAAPLPVATSISHADTAQMMHWGGGEQPLAKVVQPEEVIESALPVAYPDANVVHAPAAAVVATTVPDGVNVDITSAESHIAVVTTTGVGDGSTHC